MAAAFWIVRLLVDFHPANIPRIEETSIDGRVLLFTICVSLATALLSGLFPAWSGSRCNLNEAIKGSGARGVKGGASRLHSGLFVAEIALTIVLLTGSGLLIRSFLKLRSVDNGFASLSTITMGVQLDGRYNQPQRQNEFFHTLLARARAMPGVQEAAAVDHVPLHILHHEPRGPIAQRARVIQPGNKDVPELRQRLDLAGKAFPPGSRHPRMQQKLDRHRTAGIFAFEEAHHAHPALTQYSDEPVGADLLESERFYRRAHDSIRDFWQAPVQQRRAPAVPLQHGADFGHRS